MEYHVIGVNKREYHNHNGEYPTRYYLHTIEYPHIIQVSEDIYESVVKEFIYSFNFPILKVSEYGGEFYYKYITKRKEEK